MKKILCIVLSLLMILPTVAFASVAGEVSYSESAQNVYIAGDLSKTDVKSGSFVTLTIKDADNSIKYIEEVEVGADLTYEFKFKFTENMSDCMINIKEGDNDVTESVTVSYVTNPTVYSLTLRDENDSQLIEADEIVKATADITNKLGNDGNFKILAAFYDVNNKMTGCEEIADGSFTFYDIEKKVSGFTTVKVPAGTEKIKAFMWKNTKDIIPLSKEQTKATGDKTFGNDTEQITVAFMGDSITHGAQYLKVLEHYYHTRYPNRDIIFINKGISGNSFRTVLNRYEWDITENPITGEVDEATICLGFNDLSPANYLFDVDYDNIPEDASDEVKNSVEKINNSISNYLDRCEELIAKCRAKGISLTLVTPIVFDHEMVEGRTITTGKEQSFNFPAEVNDDGLYRMTLGIKEIAEKYDLPVIDIWTPTTEITDRVRSEYGLKKDDIVIMGNDGVHPGEHGGFYVSYVMIKQQDDTAAIVAKVEIDAATGAKATERADVVLTDYSSDKVEYEYLAHAIPVAYTEFYQNWENWGVPVTEDINNEIIKVTNLDAGTYSITIGGNKLTKNYTAEELANGVNIAIDANNPAQIQSKAAHKIAASKVSHEGTYRSIAVTEQGIRNHPEVDISKFGPNSTNDELSVLGAYSSNYKNYFSDSASNFGSKKYEVENWEKIRAEEQAAKDASKPIQRTVVIEKIQ